MSKLSGIFKSLLGINEPEESKIVEPKIEPKVEVVLENEKSVMEEPLAPRPELKSPTVEAIEVTIKNKAGVIYAICGNCETMWNLKDQISRSKRPDALSHLACPSCDKPIKLPDQISLKK